jgi:hypothetical protein
MYSIMFRCRYLEKDLTETFYLVFTFFNGGYGEHLFTPGFDKVEAQQKSSTNKSIIGGLQYAHKSQ